MSEIRSSLSEYRQRLGLTQAELGERVGVTRQTIIAIEKGSYAPSVKLAIMLARVFRCSVEDLFHYHA